MVARKLVPVGFVRSAPSVDSRLDRCQGLLAKQGPSKISDSRHSLHCAYQRLLACEDLLAAADALKGVGHAIGMPHPAVIDDYSTNRLLTIEDGRALTSVLGWEPEFVEQWLKQKLHLVSPIAAVCRMSTRPFAWESAAIARAFEEVRGRTRAEWPLTPAHGVYGGITVPIHLPRGRTGSVSWYSRDTAVNIPAVLDRHADILRLAAYRFMDLVYTVRAERDSSEDVRLTLSDRELECLTWAALGRTDIEIGSIIHRSPTTARFHIDNAVRKLAARNRTQAVAIAAQRGLIHPLTDTPAD
jgi:LuxR family quorum-sensing system transcriptional regulator CciR